MTPALQIALSFLAACVAAGLTHLFTSRRDKENKLREQRINYLVNAFRALAKACHHPRLHEIADELQQAVTDIQLFGTLEQVAMVRQFVSDFGTNKSANLDDLLDSLRDNLRSELGASLLSEGLVHIRVGP